MSNKTRRCEYCERKFRTVNDLRNHLRDKHGEVEESIADLLIQAEIDGAMGTPVEAWIKDML